jgi:hypothetical protein
LADMDKTIWALRCKDTVVEWPKKVTRKQRRDCNDRRRRENPPRWR